MNDLIDIGVYIDLIVLRHFFVFQFTKFSKSSHDYNKSITSIKNNRSYKLLLENKPYNRKGK